MKVSFSFLHLFTLLFVGLKLTNNIDWSWWYVLAPSLVPAAVLYSLAGIALLMAGVAWLLMSKEERARQRVAAACAALADALSHK